MTNKVKTIPPRPLNLLKPSDYTHASIFVLLCAALLIYPSEISHSIRQSVQYCLNLLLPTLFPFLALTSFAARSHAGEVIGRCFGFISKYFFRLPKSCTAVILLGLIGGYPTGAKGVSILYKQNSINREQAARMLLFCVNPGIAFVISFVGGTVFANPKIGVFLFISICISSIMIGVVTAFAAPFPRGDVETVRRSTANCVIECAFDASASIMKMCVLVVFFSAVKALLYACGALGAISAIIDKATPLSQLEAAALLSFVAEITMGVKDGAALKAPVYLFAFGLAFGGICVHMQIFSLLDKFPVSKIKFIIFRILHGIFAALIYVSLARAFPQATEAFAGVSGPVSSQVSMPIAGGLSLLVMCVIVLLGGRERSGSSGRLDR